VPGIALSSARLALPPGRYAARSLFGNSKQTTFTVDSRGAFSSWVPVPEIDGLAVEIMEILRR
jgi:hypothetical protein